MKNMEVELQMQREWEMAQKIDVSDALISAATKQLLFLEKIEDKGNLYEGKMVKMAIKRYSNNFLPLLANIQGEGPLFVVPIDIEWIWHCHRLNPIFYKEGCEKLYGKLLDSKNVLSAVSSVEGIKYKKQSEDMWKRMYPTEPYELNMNCTDQERYVDDPADVEFKYDLLSAVKRQRSFFYQVSRPHVKDERFLHVALARYKGFLHINRRNMEKSNRRFWVPTYDIDLMWHSHQLLPVAYNKDMLQLFGYLLGHDDSETDRTKGKKLDTGFSETTKQWEDMFGSRYWRAGAMYRGSVPAASTPKTHNVTELDPCNKNNIMVVQLMEVMVEMVAVKDLPDGHDGILFVTCSKKQPAGDAFFNIKNNRIGIFSETKEKDVFVFQCEPAGDLVFELMSSDFSSGTAKSLGTTSVSLKDDLLTKISQLYVEKWFELVPSSPGLKPPISLRIALSFTTPVPVSHNSGFKVENGGGGGHAHCGSCAGCGGSCDVSFQPENGGGGGGYAHCGSCAGCGGSCDVSFKPDNGGGAHCGSCAGGGGSCDVSFKPENDSGGCDHAHCGSCAGCGGSCDVN